MKNGRHDSRFRRRREQEKNIQRKDAETQRCRPKERNKISFHLGVFATWR
jgi:hypothetical protein